MPIICGDEFKLNADVRYRNSESKNTAALNQPKDRQTN